MKRIEELETTLLSAIHDLQDHDLETALLWRALNNLVTYTENSIIRFASEKSLIMTDCLKDDNEITLSATDESEPIFTFKRIGEEDKFTLTVEI